MLMTVSELRRFVEAQEDDQVLEAKLQALESLVRSYTNNNFQDRAFRAVAVAISEGNKLMIHSAIPFRVGDTLQVSESDFQQGALLTIESVTDDTITVKENLFDESGIIITQVKYPADVKMGVANLVKWELANRDKVGIASESISRHSVTYFNMDAQNTESGFPKALMGFLMPYKKARFGRGALR